MVLLSFDFDSVKDDIYSYASVFINGNFFIIGGSSDGVVQLSTIARLDSATWLWSRAGRLNTGRSHHGVIWSNSKLVVVGGLFTKPTEFCQWKNKEFTCTEQKSILKGYNRPLLVVVSDDYKNC